LGDLSSNADLRIREELRELVEFVAKLLQSFAGWKGPGLRGIKKLIKGCQKVGTVAHLEAIPIGSRMAGRMGAHPESRSEISKSENGYA
jgi:hypothetical protein